MDQKNYDISKMSMFYPRTKQGLAAEYPEIIGKNPVLNKLSRSELLFVWYFACKSSPFNYEEDHKEKVEKSLRMSFGKKADDVMGRYISANYSENVRLAIAEMRKFEPGPRIKAKMMVETIMENYLNMVKINPDTEFKVEGDGDKVEEDWSKKKAYIDACANISKALPNLINQAEGNFGIAEMDAEDIELESDSLIEEFHNS